MPGRCTLSPPAAEQLRRAAAASGVPPQLAGPLDVRLHRAPETVVVEFPARDGLVDPLQLAQDEPAAQHTFGVGAGSVVGSTGARGNL